VLKTTALGDRLSITGGLPTQPESCMSLMYAESRQGQVEQAEGHGTPLAFRSTAPNWKSSACR
jgi:hypothetical protein